ncbi:nucleolar protein 11 [Discoglossus pictus]
MAAFSEEFTLCGLLPGAGGNGGRSERLQGVEAAGDVDRVLVTDTGRAVTLYKVSDQKPLGSWTVKQGQQISCPAVYNHETGEYVVVHDQKVLRIWKDDDVNLDKVFKATLSSDVHRIHTVPNAEPLVVFKGGAVQFLDSLLADPQQEIESIIDESEIIQWSKMFVDAGQSILVYITEKCKDCFVHIWKFSPNIHRTYKLKSNSEEYRALDFSGYLKNKMFTLLILYSNGHVSHTLVPLVQSDQETEELLSVSSLLSLPEPADFAALTVLDDSHIAILSASASKQKDCICIWNTKFQTMQATKELPQKTSAQLWCYDGKLYLPHGKSLIVVPYTCETSSLASALGKRRNDETTALENVSLLNWDSYVGIESEAKQSNASQRKSSRQKKSKSAAVDSGEPDSLLADIQNSPPSQITKTVQSALAGVESADFHITIGKITLALVNRCKRDPKFFPQTSLGQLVQTNKLSYSLCPDLVSISLEKLDVCLLQLCLQNFPDVPEAVICSCLKTFLSVSEDKLTDAEVDVESAAGYIDVFDNTKEIEVPQEKVLVQNGFSPTILEEDSCDVQVVEKSPPKTGTTTSPVSVKRAALLNCVLTSAYSETFLLPHLKDLSAEQVILFLRYLQYLYVKCSENITESLPGKAVPTVTQVMDWMCLVFDAHFTVVVMLPEAKKLLRSLEKYVKNQMKFVSELNKIEGSLTELQKLKYQTKDCGHYSIEVLELF